MGNTDVVEMRRWKRLGPQEGTNGRRRRSESGMWPEEGRLQGMRRAPMGIWGQWNWRVETEHPPLGGFPLLSYKRSPLLPLLTLLIPPFPA
jgi:hypothetical protein